MHAIGLLYFLFALAYVWLLNHLSRVWDKDQSNKPDYFPDTSQCTLLVPFRNEEENLGLLLHNLSDRLPPNTNVLFIDDHSEDNGAAIVTLFIQESSRTKWRLIRSNGEGKKAALATGIDASKSPVIVTTDADVLVRHGWLESLLLPFRDPAIQLVAGPVMTASGTGLFSRFQQIEWASLILMSYFSFAKGHPLMCSGANLAFRRAAFYAVGGYQDNSHLLSGDDEFLLKKIAGRYGAGAMVYLTKARSLVTTRLLISPVEWISQRARWASKWNAHKGQSHWLSAFILTIFCLFLLGSIPLAFLYPELALGFGLFWAIRFMAEKKALGKVLHQYGLKASGKSWFLSGWIYPVMVLWALPFAIFGKYTWKGRKN
jgi:cellulose synthase/poly-beta-1,6-N-acetylglucosamine synthase-like glycosyltransferase